MTVSIILQIIMATIHNILDFSTATFTAHSAINGTSSADDPRMLMADRDGIIRSGCILVPPFQFQSQ